MSIDDRVARLEERVAQLEHRCRQLLDLVDGGSQRNRFTSLCFGENLTEEQETQILDLMDEVSKSIKAGTPMSHNAFEKRIYEIVPHRAGSYSFAETIVSVLNKEGRWTDVFQHMKKNGMNFG